jgi:hypothetical protein
MLICECIFPHRRVHCRCKIQRLFFGSQARMVLVTKLSQIPFATFAIVFASSGAINRESAHLRSSLNIFLFFNIPYSLTNVKDGIASLFPHIPLVPIIINNRRVGQFLRIEEVQRTWSGDHLKLRWKFILENFLVLNLLKTESKFNSVKNLDCQFVRR